MSETQKKMVTVTMKEKNCNGDSSTEDEKNGHDTLCNSIDITSSATAKLDVHNHEKRVTLPLPREGQQASVNVDFDRLGSKSWWQFWKTDMEQMAIKPVDFPRRTKRLILMTIALATLIAPISTTIYMPALVTIQNAFATDDTTMNATLSAFTFTIAICPIFWSALGDAYGRRPVYLISFIIYIIGSTCCALSVNIGMFIAFRIVSGIGSSSVLSMGAGTIADVFAPYERGRAFAMYATGPLLGPALGPIIGGYLNIGLGWRSNLAFVAIYGVIIWLCILFFLPETSRPVPTLPGQPPVKQKLKNPFSALIYFKYTNIGLSIMYTGLSFMLFYIVNTTFTRTLTIQYHLDTGIVGLCYLPLALGAMIGNQIGGRLSDYIYNRRVAAAKDGQIFPEMRISGIVIAISVVLAICAYVAYGWCTEKNVHFAYVLVSIFFLAVGLMTPTVIINTYMVDSFKGRSAAVMACASLVRFSGAGVGSLIASSLQHALGDGILFTVCGAIVALLALSVIYIKAYPQRWLDQRSRDGLT